ncbi:hypothetical protein MLD38_032380 [Melastoma candidum]|uniref:Uncharacterized protein n=1 Tax=Melastoma candidum TaxID=119954 RepID=A0ACB9M4Q5_9MYRT|nr:hypothetical protein MLD38_032380 [Melastoma candidum]
MNTTTLCNVTMVTLFAFTSLGAVASLNTRIINMECNTAHFTDESPFADALKNSMEVLKGPQVPEETLDHPLVGRSCLTNFFFQAGCSKDIGPEDCAICFSAIEYRINMLCKNNMGVQLTLQDCKLRYETYTFDGIEEQLDNTGPCPGGGGSGH